MIATILWNFKDSTGHPAYLTIGDVLAFAVMLLLLFLFCLLMARRRKTCLRIRNYLLVPLAAVGGFVIYAIGYLHGGTASSLTALSIRSFLSTFHMFFLHSDLLEVCEEMHHSKMYMTFFSLIHFLAFLISFLVVVQLFGTHFLSWLRLKCAVPRRSYLFLGLDAASATLALSLLERKEPGRLVVVFDEKGKKKWKIGKHAGGGGEGDDREVWREQLADAGVLLLSRAYSENTTCREAGVGKLLRKGKAHFFLFSADTARNLRLALKITDEIKSAKDYRANIVLYVRIDDEEMAELLESQNVPENVEIQAVHPSRLAALELIVNHPPVDYVRPDTTKAVATKDFTAMILGFGETGSNVLRLLTEHGQFIGAEYRVTVVDKDLGGRLGTFKSRYPGMEHYGVEYIPADVNSVAFWEVLRSKLDTLDYLVIALGDSGRNIQMAVCIEQFIRRVTGRGIDIFVKTDGDPAHAYTALSTLLPRQVHLFGTEDSIYTEELIVNETRWSLAKKMHDHYNREKAKSLSENTAEKALTSQNTDREGLLRTDALPQEETSLQENGRQERELPEHTVSGERFSRLPQHETLSGERMSPDTPGVKWEQLPEIRKISNLSAALHLVTKLKLAGLLPETIKKLKNKNRFIGLLGEERLENLAKGEHLHWNATLFTHGWDTWTAIPGDSSGNKDEKRKLHACLVDWEELQRIENKFGEPYREYDRVYVVNIYDWMQDAAIFEEVDKTFHRNNSKEEK